VWIEPVAPRWSSQQVIDQELDLLAWTLAAQGLEPSPSRSVERGHGSTCFRRLLRLRWRVGIGWW
jgi:hypothetical protein